MMICPFWTCYLPINKNCKRVIAFEALGKNKLNQLKYLVKNTVFFTHSCEYQNTVVLTTV